MGWGITQEIFGNQNVVTELTECFGFACRYPSSRQPRFRSDGACSSSGRRLLARVDYPSTPPTRMVFRVRGRKLPSNGIVRDTTVRIGTNLASVCCSGSGVGSTGVLLYDTKARYSVRNQTDTEQQKRGQRSPGTITTCESALSAEHLRRLW